MQHKHNDLQVGVSGKRRWRSVENVLLLQAPKSADPTGRLPHKIRTPTGKLPQKMPMASPTPKSTQIKCRSHLLTFLNKLDFNELLVCIAEEFNDSPGPNNVSSAKPKNPRKRQQRCLTYRRKRWWKRSVGGTHTTGPVRHRSHRQTRRGSTKSSR